MREFFGNMPGDSSRHILMLPNRLEALLQFVSYHPSPPQEPGHWRVLVNSGSAQVGSRLSRAPFPAGQVVRVPINNVHLEHCFAQMRSFESPLRLSMSR